MVASAIATGRSVGRRAKTLAIAAGISGNILEWYDFGVYIYWRQQLPSCSFPIPRTSILCC
jgi:hypothetical protein